MHKEELKGKDLNRKDKKNRDHTFKSSGNKLVLTTDKLKALVENM